MNPGRGEAMTMMKRWHASWFHVIAVAVIVGVLSIWMAVFFERRWQRAAATSEAAFAE